MEETTGKEGLSRPLGRQKRQVPGWAFWNDFQNHVMLLHTGDEEKHRVAIAGQ